uniref:FAD-dependent monooxygenase notI' n=1 Tax=Aspergillus versicolor TaxID=46472 RepID=NOTI_ASPVE|nr:RecName: Full=FAD-dependent monooxygenase notI'; AltName: Full=Notoamide biosynthesis cluster protein I' [Aspergillus versicolor]AGC83580.1 FAD monooxygenase [Aspergillus versicolor]
MAIDASGAAAPNSSGITVIIVGLGPTGLAAAIECHRRGHKVICFERNPKSYRLGDLINVTGNAARVLQGWGNGSVINDLQAFQCNLDTLEVYDETGDLKLSAPYNANQAKDNYMLRRSRLLDIFLQHLKNLDVDIHLGTEVTDYWETESSAGVTVGGKRIAADCVVVADGVHSKGRPQVSAEPFDLPSTDGTAFRAFFHASEIAQDPEASWILQDAGEGDCFKTFYGKGLVMMLGTAENHEYIFWSCGSKENVLAQSSAVAQVLDLIGDWPVSKRLAPLISKTPSDNCLDQTLFTRSPLNKWVSRKGRMIVLGDAAHPFLPHAGQGANQGIEDAAVLALCLQIAGKDDVPLALRVTEKLRYQRVAAIQKRGVEARDQSLSVDWENGGFTKKLTLYPAWLHDQDCIKQVYEEFDKAVAAVTKGHECTFGGIPVD